MAKKQTKKLKKGSVKVALLTQSFWRPWRIAIAVIVLASIILNILVLTKTQLAVRPQFMASNHKVDAPFVVSLGQKINSLPLDDITTTPHVQGEWTLQQGSLLSDDQLVFTPQTYFAVNTEYTVKLPVIERVVAGLATVDPITFTTERAPSVAEGGVAALQDSQIVSARHAFGVTLSSPNRGLRTLELRTSPKLQLTRTSADDTTFTWQSNKLLPQGKTVAVEVYDTKNDVLLLKKTIKIAPQPQLKPLAKTTYYRPNDNIALTFSEPMDPDAKELITFNTPGTGKWKNPTTYEFMPSGIQPGVSYDYAVKSGVKSQAGGETTKKYMGRVTTTGAVSISGMSPYGSELSQSSQRISFTFDQAVDHESVEKRFNVSRGALQRKEWNGNTFTATVTKLGYQQTVTASIGAGVKNASFGLPSTRGFSVSFTTEVRTRRLNGVPLYQQQYAASCTAASLRMLLAAKGVSTNDRAIVNAMGYAPTKMNKSKKPYTWDDPNLMFVGDINGSIAAGTG
ncbi:MAG: Ig-like domain-containing protein, partial [Candidatus Saccharimonadales bacterium]